MTRVFEWAIREAAHEIVEKWWAGTYRVGKTEAGAYALAKVVIVEDIIRKHLMEAERIEAAAAMVAESDREATIESTTLENARREILSKGLNR